jgi:hypothetical protein
MPPKIVAVPKSDPTAFNPNRPAGALLKAQTLHLREALHKHLQELAAVLAIDPNTLKTEGDVSTYIQTATAILHTVARRQRK